VIVRTADGPRSIYKTVGSGGSFGASPLRQEFGLGAAQSIQGIEILWPATGQTQRLEGLAFDRFYRIREGVALAQAWEPKRFQLAAGTDKSPHQPGHAHH
jgi:hypothetical protein